MKRLAAVFILAGCLPWRTGIGRPTRFRSVTLRVLLCAIVAPAIMASRCPLGPGSDLVTVLFTAPSTTGYQATAFDSEAPASFTATAHLNPGATFCARTHMAVVGASTIILQAVPDSGGVVFRTSFQLAPPACSHCLGSAQSWTWDGRSPQAAWGHGWC